MCSGKTAKRVSFVSESKVFVKFYAVDGEDPARETFRRAQNSIKYDTYLQRMFT
jgi:hypothetical protein